MKKKIMKSSLSESTGVTCLSFVSDGGASAACSSRLLLLCDIVLGEMFTDVHPPAREAKTDKSPTPSKSNLGNQ